MQEPYKKGVAIHLGPESCADRREAVGEALTGGHAGQPLSSEIITPACRPCPDRGKATPPTALGELSTDAAESETLSMRGNSMRENRETSKTPSRVTDEGRPEKAFSRTSGVNVFEESDDLVVPAKRANNVGQPATAESVEGRRSREGTGLHANHVPDTVPESTGRLAVGPRSARPLPGQAYQTRAKSRMR